MAAALALPAAALLALTAAARFGGRLPGHPNALGTARVLAVDPAATPAVGRKHFPVTLPLAPKEVVLTFDDGPWPGTTDAVLAALRRGMRQGELLPARPQRGGASGAGPEGAGRGAHRRRTTPIRIRCSAA